MSAILSEVEKEEIEKTIELLASGKTIGESLGASKNAIEAVYALAYSYMQAGNYDDAKNLLVMLTLYNHKDARFFIALGSCLQMQNDFLLAVEAFYAAIILTNAKDPLPIYQVAVCSLKLGNKEEAISLLEAVEHIDENSNNGQIIKKSIELLSFLKSE